MTLQAVGNENDVHAFLDFIFGVGTGTVYVPTREVGKGAFNQRFFNWPQDRSAVADWIMEQTGEREVYIAPALFNSAEGGKQNVKQSRVVWCEFDGVIPTIESLASSGIPVPSMRIQSSGTGHEHWYWQLSEPITEIAEIERINRALTYTLGADASGWDANQILRPPNTKNHKRDKIVTVTHAVTVKPAYPVGDFDFLQVELPETDEISADIIPDVADIILAYPWPADAIALYRTQTPSDRSNALMALGYFCAEMGMRDNEIYSVVRNADDRWGKFKGRTDRHQRLLDLIVRVRAKYPTTEVAEDVFPVYGFRSLLESEIELSWVVPGLLEENGYMLLVGPSGVGKTQWSLRWAMNLALGRNFLGFQIDAPKRILFISCEMNHAGIKYFMSIMAKDMSDEELQTLEENLLVAPIGEPLLLDTPDGQSVLIDLIEYHKPDGFMFDSVGSATSGDISSEGPVKAIMGFNDHLRNKYGIWTWYIHHQRKAQSDNKKPNKLSDVYGNQYLVNRATSVVLLWPMKDRIEISDLKVRLAPMGEPWEVQRLSNLDFVKLEQVKIMPKHLEYKPSAGVPVDMTLFDDPNNVINKKPPPDTPPAATTNLQGLM